MDLPDPRTQPYRIAVDPTGPTPESSAAATALHEGRTPERNPLGSGRATLSRFEREMFRRLGSASFHTSGDQGGEDTNDDEMVSQAQARTCSRPDIVALKLLTARAFGRQPDALAALRGGAAVLLRVPDASYVRPLSRVAPRVLLGPVEDVRPGWSAAPGEHLRPAPDLFVFDRDGTGQDHGPDFGGDRVGYAALTGAPLLGIAVDPNASLPRELVRLARFEVVLPPLQPDLVGMVVRLVTGHRTREKLPARGVALLSPRDLNATVRPALGADGSIREVARVAEAAVRAGVGDGPRLEDLAGYGDAGAWGLAVVEAVRLAEAGGPWKADPGICLVGPPGVGKTTFARALARSCGLPLHLASATGWMAGHGLPSILRRIRADFAQARRAPGLFFIDEINALPARDAPDDNRFRAFYVAITNAVLEGFDTLRGCPVVVLAACNDSSKLDSALVRSGRLDRVVTIPLPDAAARQLILRHHLAKDLDGEDLSEFVALLAGTSGADIERIVRDARKLAGSEQCSKAHMLRAIAGPDTRTATELRAYALHAAGHAVAAAVLGLEPGHLSIRTSQIAAQTSNGHVRDALGSTGALTRDEILNRVVVTLSGRAADEVLGAGGSTEAGGDATSDLAQATDAVVALAARYGLGPDSDISWRGEIDSTRRNLPLGLERAVRADLDLSYAKAKSLVSDHRRAVLEVAERLVARGWLDGSTICSITRGQVEPRPAGGESSREAGPSAVEFGPRRATSVACDAVEQDCGPSTSDEDRAPGLASRSCATVREPAAGSTCSSPGRPSAPVTGSAPRGRLDYASYITSAAWLESNARQTELRLARWRCRFCGRGRHEARIEVHHRTYRRLGRERAEDLCTLCSDCHRDLTAALRVRKQKHLNTAVRSDVCGGMTEEVVDQPARFSDRPPRSFDPPLPREGGELANGA